MATILTEPLSIIRDGGTPMEDSDDGSQYVTLQDWKSTATEYQKTNGIWL